VEDILTGALVIAGLGAAVVVAWKVGLWAIATLVGTVSKAWNGSKDAGGAIKLSSSGPANPRGGPIMKVIAAVLASTVFAIVIRSGIRQYVRSDARDEPRATEHSPATSARPPNAAESQGERLTRGSPPVCDVGVPNCAALTPGVPNTAMTRGAPLMSAEARARILGQAVSPSSSVRACQTVRTMEAFHATPAGELQSGEGYTSLRLRCSEYLTSRGLDDGICFPADDDNPHPVCPPGQ
jgi:hypothetical protein